MDKSKIKITVTIAMIAVLIVSLVALCIGYVDKKDFGKDSNYITDENGNKMENDKVYPMPKNIQFNSMVQNNSVMLTVEVLPVNATNKNIDFSMKWQNSESEFSVGKNVVDYISLEKSSPNIVAINVLKPFGEKIILIAVSEDNTELKAECVLDYKARIKSITGVYIKNRANDDIKVNLSNNDISNDKLVFQKERELDMCYFDFDYELSVCTIVDMNNFEFNCDIGISLAAAENLSQHFSFVFNFNTNDRLPIIRTNINAQNNNFSFGLDLFSKLFDSRCVYDPNIDWMENDYFRALRNCLTGTKEGLLSIPKPDYHIYFRFRVGYSDIEISEHITFEKKADIDIDSLMNVGISVSSIHINDSNIKL